MSEVQAPKAPKAIDLADLIPKDSELSLEVNGKKETFKIRMINMDDHVWFKKAFGNNPNVLQDAISGMDAEKVVKIVYRLMDQEGKKHFPAMTIKEIDDDGNMTEKTISGPENLRRNLKWPQGLMDVTKALLEVVGLSSPVLDDMDLEVLKKNDPITGTPSEVRTGVASTMQWPQNTDTPSKNLDDSR